MVSTTARRLHALFGLATKRFVEVPDNGYLRKPPFWCALISSADRRFLVSGTPFHFSVALNSVGLRHEAGSAPAPRPTLVRRVLGVVGWLWAMYYATGILSRMFGPEGAPFADEDRYAACPLTPPCNSLTTPLQLPYNPSQAPR